MPDTLPELDPGLTRLSVPEPRSTALHRLAVAELGRRDGPAFWVDARNTAVTHALYDLAPSRRRLDGLRVARAFTAYQHHALVRRLVRRVDPGTGLVVAPSVAALYRDDDVPAYEAERLLDAALSLLGELADACGLRVLLTVHGDDDAAARVADACDHAVTCERTRMGLRYDAPGYDHPGYWRDGAWQTTVPYWVDLLGTVERDAPVRPPAPGLEVAD